MDRRDRYLDAAVALFARHGFVGTSMDMLVREVGGSKATLYKHFASKDALVAGIMEKIVAAPPTTNAVPGPEVPIDEALDRFGTFVLRAVISERAIVIVRLALGEYGRFPELAALVWRAGPAVSYERFIEFMRLREANGELDIEDPQLAAEQFIAGIVGHIQLKVAMGQCDPPDDDDVLRRVRSARQTFLARYGREA